MEYTPIDEAVDRLRHYLNVVFTNEDKLKVKGIITSAIESYKPETKTKVIRKTVYEKIYVFKDTVDKTNPSKQEMDLFADELCKKHGITYSEFTAPARRGGTRKKIVVQAREEFIKHFYQGYYPDPSYIASYFGVHRTTILYHRDGTYSRAKKREYMKSRRNGQNTRV